MTVFRSEYRTAAKSYRCDECRRQIAVGERYCSWFQLFDGEAYYGHTCPRCEAMRAEAWQAFDWFDPEDAAPLGELRQHLIDHEDVADPEAWLDERLAAKAAGAKRAAQIHDAVALYQGASL
jgi:hypothetical protein